MGKKDRMKNGLQSLFEDNSTEAEDNAEARDEGGSGTLTTVRLSLIEPDRKQPRKNFDEEKLSELAENIAQVGVLQPIIVRPAKAEGRYTIVAGERRWRAARIAGLTEVPVIVREIDDALAAQLALIENLQREDLDPVEEARAFKRLKSAFSMTQEEIAKAIGRSRSAVANSLRLLELEPECIEALEQRKITAGHARALLAKQNRDSQLVLLQVILSEELSVREAEKLAAEKTPAKRPPERRSSMMSSSDKAMEEYRLSMKDTFGVDAVFKKGSGGKLTMKVSFDGEDEMKEFLKRLMDK